MAAGGALALLLYGWFLSVGLASALGGEARIAQAYAALAALGLLWLVLFVLVIVDRVLGGPSWSRRAGVLLVPVAAIADVFATDYPSNRLCQIIVLAMPLLAGAYVALGRLPARHAARAQALALLVMAALSFYAIRLFMQ
jgi:hypothetical protein